jgi:hypothetical protein
MNLIRASSPGAGNSFYIEKIHHCLKSFSVQNVVVQLSESTRVVTGFTEFENTADVDIESPQSVGDLSCYTWNIHDNESNIKRITGKTAKIDDVWFKQVSSSKWIDYKVMQDIMTIQYLCDSYNVPVLFWSWFRPMEDLFIEQYKWLEDKINWLPGCAIDYIHNHQIKPGPDGHWGTDAHNQLVDDWLYPQINI